MVPRILSSHSTSKVLTMEWLDGVSLADPRLTTELGIDPAPIIEMGVRCRCGVNPSQALSGTTSWSQLEPVRLDSLSFTNRYAFVRFADFCTSHLAVWSRCWNAAFSTPTLTQAT